MRIRLLAGTAPRDIRHEPVGGFAGPVAPDAPIGTYGGRVVQRRRGAGSFAGDPDQQRQGSFADTDRDVIVTYKGDAARARITGPRGARRLLRRAALDDDAVDRAVGDLHQGHAILLVDLRYARAGRPLPRSLDGTRHAEAPQGRARARFLASTEGR
jgi:hypothetical protein